MTVEYMNDTLGRRRRSLGTCKNLQQPVNRVVKRFLYMCNVRELFLCDVDEIRYSRRAMY